MNFSSRGDGIRSKTRAGIVDFQQRNRTPRIVFDCCFDVIRMARAQKRQCTQLERANRSGGERISNCSLFCFRLACTGVPGLNCRKPLLHPIDPLEQLGQPLENRHRPSARRGYRNPEIPRSSSQRECRDSPPTAPSGSLRLPQCNVPAIPACPARITLSPITDDPASPVCAQISVSFPTRDPCPICTRLSILLPSPISVEPTVARSTQRLPEHRRGPQALPAQTAESSSSALAHSSRTQTRPPPRSRRSLASHHRQVRSVRAPPREREQIAFSPLSLPGREPHGAAVSLPDPSLTFGPITTYAPMCAPSPISAVGSTTAVG